MKKVILAAAVLVASASEPMQKATIVLLFPTTGSTTR